MELASRMGSLLNQKAGLARALSKRWRNSSVPRLKLKLKIDKELADIKNAVNAERAAFGLKPPKPRRKKQGSLPLGVE